MDNYPSHRIKTSHILILVLILGFSLGIYRLDYQLPPENPFCCKLDEGYSIHHSKKSIISVINENNYNPLKIVRAYDPAGNPPLHFIVLHYAQRFLGDSLFYMRLPSLIFGVLTILLTYLTGKTFFGQKEGLIAAFLLSISSYHLWYMQEARPYTMFTFFSILSVYLFYMSINTKSAKHWIGFIFATTLLLYTHYDGIYIPLIELLFIVILLSTKTLKTENTWELLPPFTSFSAIFILTLPAILHILDAYGGRIRSAELGELISLKYVTTIGGAYLGYNFTQLPGDLASLVLYTSAPLQLLAWSFFALTLRGHDYRSPNLFLALLISLPLLTMTLLSAIPFETRYLLFVLPFYLIGVTRGITNLTAKLTHKPIDEYALIFLILIILTVPQAITIYHYYGLNT